MTGKTLLLETKRWGVKLSRRGDKLVVSPAYKCPPELIALLREHKSEVMGCLEARDAGLSVSCGPWLHVARQVLAGEFADADGSTRESLSIGLRAVGTAVCKRALERLAADGEAKQ